MIGRLLVVALLVSVAVPVSAQQRQRSTANWGTMPNGWVDHGTPGWNRSQFPRDNPGAGIPTYRVPVYPRFYNPYYPGYYGYRGFYGGYTCGYCGSPYCFDPYCRGTIVSGLSLNVFAPQIIVPPVVGGPNAGLLAAPVPVGRVAGDPLPGDGGALGRDPLALEPTGLPWLDRLRREQAAAFEAGETAAQANRDAAFRARSVDVLADQPILDGKRSDLSDPIGIALEDGDAANPIRQRVAKQKTSNEADRRKSDRLIAEADRWFVLQEFPKAAQRYRQAINVAPDYPKALFRVGHYFVAVGEYEQALSAYLMALEAGNDINQSGFKLDDLYKGNLIDKMSHLDALADAALRDPENGGLLMLVGLTLYYDQQPAKSADFFLRAAETKGPQSVYAKWFLTTLGAE